MTVQAVEHTVTRIVVAYRTSAIGSPVWHLVARRNRRLIFDIDGILEWTELIRFIEQALGVENEVA